MIIHILIILIALMFGDVGLTRSFQDNRSFLEETACFSSNYGEAREKFLAASRAAGAELESFKNPFQGPDGEALYTDVVLLGAKDAETMLLLISGTHGVEGFTGSAIQTCLLRDGFDSDLKPDMGIVLIHAVNPYGFAYLRRFNEDNVDLNRNFVDHSKPYPANPGYDKLQDAISPEHISSWKNAKSLFSILRYRLQHGKTALKKAISGGQYTDPQGLFYGGNGETWSNTTIRAISARFLAQAKRIVVIDFHTGLGPYGNAEIIMNKKKSSPAYQRSVKWWGNRVKSTANAEAVSIHLETTLKLAVPKMLPDAEVTAVTLEFGTLPTLKAFWALRAENWLYHHGDKNTP
ncbi:MAG: M14 family metallopeptidase, partial [Desulfobulbales bacterium]|nr:M14 family metallopeptidase [Desulfobulbales bacterium]